MINYDNQHLRKLIKSLPKVDLHCHLPGSIRIDTIIEFSKKYGFTLPTYDPIELRKFLQAQPEMKGDLNLILRSLGEITSFCFPDTEAIERIAYEMMEDAWNDGVIALEARFSPLSLTSKNNLQYSDIIDAVSKGFLQAKRRYDIHFGIILGITRQAPIEFAHKTVELAINAKPDWNLVGIDLSGEEKEHPPVKFTEVFNHIKNKSNLGITIHAGEASGAKNVKDSIEILHANRIGHGVRSIEDKKVIELIKERQIIIETCPTSNVITGAVQSIEKHPLKWFIEEKVLATINTDDPSWFDTNLSKEYLISYNEIGLSFDQLKQSTLNATKGLFTSDLTKKKINQKIGDFFLKIKGP